jgi:hypothetical protein
MALVTGPFMSLDASGTLAGTLTASHWKGRNYMRQRVIPLNPRSAKQLGVRAMLKFLGAHWAAMDAGDKDDYDEDAEAKAISAFNQYCSANLLRWQQNKTPTEGYPAAEASTPLTVSDMTLTGHEGYATVALTPSAATAIQGFAIYRDTAAITDPNWANCIAIIEADGANQVTYTDSPLDADTYHYRACVFNTDGVSGTVIADDTCDVT